MGQPENRSVREIEEEIEQTRTQLASTVDQLVYRTKPAPRGIVDLPPQAGLSGAARRAAPGEDRSDGSPFDRPMTSVGPLGDEESRSASSRTGSVRRGAPSGTRTPNPVIKSHLLCQLS